VKSCIICADPRSGSWLLADLLDQTEVAGRPEEYFRPDHKQYWAKEWGISAKSPVSQYIGNALAHTSTDNGVFSVKLHWYQLEWLINQLRALPGADRAGPGAALIGQWLPQPHYVHLHRADTVRQAISWYRATYTDQWFDVVDDDPGDGQPRYFRPIPLPDEPDWGHIRFLENGLVEHERRWSEFFAGAGITPLEVQYEEMAGAPGETMRCVLDFIGVQMPDDVPEPRPRLRKQADEVTERWVREYLARRDSVEPVRLDLDPLRLTVIPQVMRPEDAGVPQEAGIPQEAGANRQQVSGREQ
jgi:LPS sulfotransferase NodH